MMSRQASVSKSIPLRRLHPHLHPLRLHLHHPRLHLLLPPFYHPMFEGSCFVPTRVLEQALCDFIPELLMDLAKIIVSYKQFVVDGH